MFIVIHRQLNPILDWTKPIEIMDTDDCVIEKYTSEEYDRLLIELQKAGLSIKNPQQYAYTTENFLRGSLVLNEGSLFYIDKTVLKFDIVNKNNLEILSGEDLVLRIKAVGHFYENDAVKVQYVEKLGSYYRMCLLIMAFVPSSGFNSWQSLCHVFVWLDKERFIGIEPVDLNMCYCNPDFVVDKSLLARLKVGLI